jgi:hypothetical protein
MAGTDVLHLTDFYRAETKVLARATSKKYVKQYARAVGIKLASQTG